MSDPARANARRVLITQAVVGAPIALAGLVVGVAVAAIAGSVIAGVVVVLLAVMLAVVALWRIRSTAVDVVVRSSDARPILPSEQPRLHNLVDGLCVSSGVPVPDLHLVDDPALNVMVFGRDPRDAGLVFTSGMLGQLDRIELEGVIAHLLARIRDDDVGPATVAAVVARWLPSMPARVLAPDRITAADIEACGLTRYPPGLISALEKMAGVSTVTPVATPATAHLWFARPLADDRSSDSVPPPHPTLPERIALLREL